MDVSYECLVFLGMCLTGAIGGAAFDVFRIVRLQLPAKPVISGIIDGIFWMAAGIGVCGSLWHFASGRLRAYEFLGIFLGIILYFSAFGGIFRWILLKIVKIIRYILKYLLTPPAFLSKILIEAFQNMKRKPREKKKRGFSGKAISNEND